MNLFKYILSGVAMVTFSCNDDQPSPVLVPSDLVPISYTEAGLTKTLTFDHQGHLTQIQYATTYSDGNTLNSYHDFSYNSNGRLTESTTDTGWRYVYAYGGDKIIRTDEFVNGESSDYHIFYYDDKGRLVEKITYQDIPMEGGEIPVAKDTYEYDQHDNVIHQRLYYYTSYGEEAKLLSEFEFSDYDDKINAEEFFDVMGINPEVRLRKNNPGRMLVKNDAGGISTTENYTYQYHALGYPLRKWVEVFYYHGGRGKYEAVYTFKE